MLFSHSAPNTHRIHDHALHLVCRVDVGSSLRKHLHKIQSASFGGQQQRRGSVLTEEEQGVNGPVVNCNKTQSLLLTVLRKLSVTLAVNWRGSRCAVMRKPVSTSA